MQGEFDVATLGNLNLGQDFDLKTYLISVTADITIAVWSLGLRFSLPVRVTGVYGRAVGCRPR